MTEAKSTFPKWLICYEDPFTVDLKEWADNWKFRLLLRKLGLAEHEPYFCYILPKHSWDYNFAETVEILKQIFSERTSLFKFPLTV